MKRYLLLFCLMIIHVVCLGSDKEGLVKKVNAFYKKKDFVGAEKFMIKAIATDSTNKFLFYYLAQVQLRNNKLDLAVISFNKAHECSPNDSRILLARGNLKEELKDTIGALEDFDRAALLQNWLIDFIS